MIRTEVHALGMLVDILKWDGNIEEVSSFGPEGIIGETSEGVTLIGSMRGVTEKYRRYVQHGDLLVRPAGRDDITPLHFFGDTWWVEALRLDG